MRRSSLASLSVLACACSSSQGLAPSPTGDTTSTICSVPAKEENALRVVESAKMQAPWVEVSVTVAFPDPPFDWAMFGMSSGAEHDKLLAQRMADLAPIGDDLASRLRAIGGRAIVQLWLSADDAAIVPAGHVPEIPCWPQVTDVEGDGLTTNGPLEFSCFSAGTCGAPCTSLVGDRLDIARGCAQHGAPVACSPLPTSDGAPLTCYVEIATGAAFAVPEPFLVEMGDTGVRKCTPPEGGTTMPASLPECP